MSAFTLLVKPLAHAARAFFRHDLALQRDEDGVRIVLEDRASGAGPRPPSRAEAAALKAKQELALMLAQLAELLDERPETRRTMRQLAFVEQALAKKGLRALHQVPLEPLRKALEQFEGLVINWSPVGLACLRAKMAVAVIDREHMDPDAEADAYQTSALMDMASLDPIGAGLEVVEPSDDEALSAAYAALGAMAPTGVAVEMQGELGSPSARAVGPPGSEEKPLSEVRLRELQP